MTRVVRELANRTAVGICSIGNFGRSRTFSAMKQRMSCSAIDTRLRRAISRDPRDLPEFASGTKLPTSALQQFVGYPR
jgi:hypothetical protein